jgi:hypothetical protein
MASQQHSFTPLPVFVIPMTLPCGRPSLAPRAKVPTQCSKVLSLTDRIVTEGSFLLRAEWLKQHPSQQASLFPSLHNVARPSCRLLPRSRKLA